MTPDERAELINAFILYNQTEDMKERDRLFWAFIKMHEVCREHPCLALAILDQLVHAARDAKVLTMVACGPLEDLLKEHGELIMDKLGELVRGGSLLRRSIHGLWHYVSSEPVQLRLQELAQIQFEEDDVDGEVWQARRE